MKNMKICSPKTHETSCKAAQCFENLIYEAVTFEPKFKKTLTKLNVTAINLLRIPKTSRILI